MLVLLTMEFVTVTNEAYSLLIFVYSCDCPNSHGVFILLSGSVMRGHVYPYEYVWMFGIFSLKTHAICARFHYY